MASNQDDVLKHAMQLAINMAHVYSFVGDDTFPNAKKELEDYLRAALSPSSDDKAVSELKKAEQLLATVQKSRLERDARLGLKGDDKAVSEQPCVEIGCGTTTGNHHVTCPEYASTHTDSKAPIDERVRFEAWRTEFLQSTGRISVTPYEAWQARARLASQVPEQIARDTHGNFNTGCEDLDLLLAYTADKAYAGALFWRSLWWEYKEKVLEKINKASQVPDEKLEIRLCDDGTLDEVVGTGPYHLEQMNDGHWWISFEDMSGEYAQVNLTSRGKIKAGFEHSCVAAAPLPPNQKDEKNEN